VSFLPSSITSSKGTANVSSIFVVVSTTGGDGEAVGVGLSFKPLALGGPGKREPFSTASAQKS